MRRFFALICIVVFLCGCGSTESLEDNVLSLRRQLLTGEGCSFDLGILTDYGDKCYEFSMHCRMEKDGNVRFTVTSPERISGISGVLGEVAGGLTFDDQVLAFEMMAGGMITPVSAPWHMLEALKGGYLHGYCENEDGLLVQIDDSYRGENIMSEIQLDEAGKPVSCQLFWSGRRFMTLFVSNFTFL